jgi:hypothetical protein
VVLRYLIRPPWAVVGVSFAQSEVGRYGRPKSVGGRLTEVCAVVTARNHSRQREFVLKELERLMRWHVGRGFPPLLLLMIGAGLALSSKTVRDRATEAAGPAMDKAKEMMGDAADGAQSLRGEVRDAVSSARSRATGMASDAQDAAAGLADDLRNRAAQTASTVTDKLRTGMDAASGMAKETLERARSTVNDAATAAPERARQVIGHNTALIGGLGLAIGAIIAASLPATRAEATVMGRASDGVKRAAGDAAQSGFEAAKDAAVSMADAAAKSVADADLGGHASRMTQTMTGTLKEVADDVVTAAFNPSRNPNT